jgi:hypothetical protein
MNPLQRLAVLALVPSVAALAPQPPTLAPAVDCSSSLTLTVPEGFHGELTLVLNVFPPSSTQVDGCCIYAMANYAPDSSGASLVGTSMLKETPGALGLTAWGASGEAYLFSFLEAEEAGTGSFQAGLGGPELARWTKHPE